jgi:hypothetical protein
MFCLQTGDNEACVWDPRLNLFILIRDRKCYNLSPRTFAHYDYRDNMRLQLVSNLIELREPESGEDRDLFTAFIYKVIGCFSDPATAHRAIRTVLIEKEAEKRAVEQVIDDVFMRKIMVYSHYLFLTRVVCISASEGAYGTVGVGDLTGWQTGSK